MPENIPPNRPDYTLLTKASNIVGALVILTLGGHWLDTKLHTQSVFILVGAGFGILYTFYEAWALLKENKDL